MVSRVALALFIAFGFGSLAVAVDAMTDSPGPRFTWGDSLPTKLVWFSPRAPVERGQIAEACYPTDIVHFADENGIVWPKTLIPICPGNLTPVFKIVAAVEGDFVESLPDGVFVNGHRFPLSDRSYPKLFTAREKQSIPPGYVFLLGWNVDSFDSRYFGVVPASVIRGRIYPTLPSVEFKYEGS